MVFHVILFYFILCNSDLEVYGHAARSMYVSTDTHSLSQSENTLFLIFYLHLKFIGERF